MRKPGRSRASLWTQQDAAAVSPVNMQICYQESNWGHLPVGSSDNRFLEVPCGSRKTCNPCSPGFASFSTRNLIQVMLTLKLCKLYLIRKKEKKSKSVAQSSNWQNQVRLLRRFQQMIEINTKKYNVFAPMGRFQLESIYLYFPLFLFYYYNNQ